MGACMGAAILVLGVLSVVVAAIRAFFVITYVGIFGFTKVDVERARNVGTFLDDVINAFLVMGKDSKEEDEKRKDPML